MLIHAGGGGVGHFAVQFASYFGAHVTVDRLGAQRGVAARTRRVRGHRPHDHALRGGRGGRRRRHRPRRQRGRRDRPRSLGVLRPGGLYILVPTGSWPGVTPTQRPRPACAPRATRSIPDGSALATVARLLDSGAVQVYIDRVFDLADAAAAHTAARGGPHPRQDRAARQRRLIGRLRGRSGRARVAPRRRSRRRSRRAGRSAGSTAASTAARRPAARPARRARPRRAPRPPGTPAAAPSRARAAPPSRSRPMPARSAAAARPDRPRGRAATASADRRGGRSPRAGAAPSALGRWTIRHPSLDERRCRDRLVAHRSERAHPASGHRRRARGDRAHHGARLEQAGGEVLVVAVQFEDDRMPLPEPGERREEPGGQRVGVDGQRHRHGAAVGVAGVRAELSDDVVLEQRDLAGEPDDRRARLGRPHRLGAHQHHPAELLLERLDALAHGRGGDVQAPGGGIQGALVDDGGDGLGQLDRRCASLVMLMQLKNHELE